MFKMLTAVVATFCLFALASKSFAQNRTVNVNQIRGNGNTVVNRTSGGGSTTNLNNINGNANRVINSTTGGGSIKPQPQPIGIQRTTVVRVQPTYSYAPAPVYRSTYVQPTVQYVAPAPVAPVAPVTYEQPNPVEYAAPAPTCYQPKYGGYTAHTGYGYHHRSTGLGGGTGGLNFNLNAIQGNGNRVINSNTGGGNSINVNRINGNGNTVVNRR